MEKPRINIKPNRIDYLFETITIIGLICLIIFPLIYFGKLPDTIPKHFDFHGQPDSFGNKWFIWYLPIIGIVLYTGLTVLNKYHHLFSYPTKVTNENAEKVYKKGIIVIRLVKLTIILLLVYLNLKSIEIGLGQIDKLSGLFLPVFLIVNIGLIFFSIILLRK
jgi:uncharacterized membrane protein